MYAHGVKVRFIRSLEPCKVVTHNCLTLLYNCESPVDGVVERDAEEPFDVDELRNLVTHHEHIPRVQHCWREGLT